MRAVGIIAEYNPFHNGHLYHINETKKLFPNHLIIVVLGGNFLQRGEPSIINKWNKTKIILEYGVDIVIELPFPFATQSADIFAQGAIEILKHMKIEYLVFGSESNDINNLINLAKIQLEDKDFDIKVKEYLKEGINYPTATFKSLNDISNIKVNTPNDILGICYIKEILKQKTTITPSCIKRTNDYHSKALNSNVVSATSIRNAIKNNIDIKEYVPKITYQYLNNNLHFIDNYFSLLKYKILSDIDNLVKYQTVDEGIENKIKKDIINSVNIEDLINKIKTKRYTYNRIQRMLTHILTSFTKEEANLKKNIEYIRVLGFTKEGQQYLNKIKKEIDIPIISRYSKQHHELLKLELKITSIYASILNEQDKIELIEAEYKNSPIKK